MMVEWSIKEVWGLEFGILIEYMALFYSI